MQKKKGISLIVLVITIIVMIILAAAVIISLNNSGIISKANKAVKETNEQEVNHIAELAWSEAYLNKAKTKEEFETAINTALENNGIDTSKYIIEVTTKGVSVHDKNTWWVQDGLNISKGNVTLEAGDLIQYNAGVQGYSGSWKVLGAEDGKLLIISTDKVDSLSLYGLRGGIYSGETYEYGILNVIDGINAICSIYGSGTGAVGTRSVKEENIDKLTGYDKTTYGIDRVEQYGNELTYSYDNTNTGKVNFTTSNGKNGTLNRIHNDGFSYIDFNTMTEHTVPLNGSKMPTIKNTYYTYQIYNMSTISQKTMNLIVTDYNYWLSSPCTITWSSGNGIWFGLKYIKRYANERGNLMEYEPSYNSYEGNIGGGYIIGVRAVVELSPNINIGTKDATLGWSYTV